MSACSRRTFHTSKRPRRILSLASTSRRHLTIKVCRVATLEIIGCSWSNRLGWIMYTANARHLVFFASSMWLLRFIWRSSWNNLITICIEDFDFVRVYNLCTTVHPRFCLRRRNEKTCRHTTLLIPLTLYMHSCKLQYRNVGCQRPHIP